MRPDVTITKLKRKFKYIPALSLAIYSLAACTNIDCPLDNVVVATCGLYSAEDQSSLTISDTLSVLAGGVKDTVLLNSAQDISSFQIPMRQSSAADTLLLRFSNAMGQTATDTIYCGHTNSLHF